MDSFQINDLDLILSICTKKNTPLPAYPKYHLISRHIFWCGWPVVILEMPKCINEIQSYTILVTQSLVVVGFDLEIK